VIFSFFYRQTRLYGNTTSKIKEYIYIHIYSELDDGEKGSSVKLDVSEALSEDILTAVSLCTDQDSSGRSNIKISPEQNFRTSLSSTTVPSFSKTRTEPTIPSLLLLFTHEV